MNLNQVAFCTSSALAIGTIASVAGAAFSVTAVATVAYSALALTLGGGSIASISAYCDKTSTDVSSYLNNVKKHSGYAIAGVYQLVAQTAIKSLIEGAGEGISKAISRKIGGADHTHSVIS